MTVDLQLISAAVLAPALAGGLTLCLPRQMVLARVLLMLAGMATALAIVASFLGQPGTHAVAWMPTLGLDWAFQLDGLSTFFALLISGMGVLIALYGRAYFGNDCDSCGRFYPLLGFFATAMLGLVLADSFTLMLLFWELTSVSSYLLIGWERRDPAAVRSAEQAFIITAAGGLVLMAGLILLHRQTGAWRFSDLPADMASFGTGVQVAFGMIFFGAAAKSAQWPMHFWLPGAMAAPTPVSAYLHSATMVKAGIYLMGRLWPSFSLLEHWPIVLISFGAATMLVGAFMSLRKTDLKLVFAYATVNHLGLLMAMYGLAGLSYHGKPNLEWDLTQILSHATYKAPLFILIGAIGHLAHTRELWALRGLYRGGGVDRVLAVLLLAAGFCLAAWPGSLSFAAKELFFYQVWHGYQAAHAIAWQANLFYVLIGVCVFSGACNTAIFVRMLRSFLSPRLKFDAENPKLAGPDEESPAHHIEHSHERGLWFAMLWVPAAVLLIAQLIGGAAWPVWAWLVAPIETNRNYFEHFPGLFKLLHPGVPLAMSGVSILLGLVVGFAPILRRHADDAHDKLYPALSAVLIRCGGMLYALVQGGSLTKYIGVMIVVMAALVGWAAVQVNRPIFLDTDFARPWDLQAGFFVALLVVACAIALPIVRERPIRVLLLGTAGFAVAAMFYLYQAPDLALTQISIEIVSLVLFLLVLAMLPREKPAGKMFFPVRAMIALGGGAAMTLLVLSAATADRPERPQRLADNARPTDLGTFFLRNSYQGLDTADASAALATPGTVDRARHEGTKARKHEGDEIAQLRPNAEQEPTVDSSLRRSVASSTLHPGGGGNNVVNVILVDFRGFDTLGEITVLGIAAMGVWTLVRRSKSDPPHTRPLEPALPLSTAMLKTASIVLVPTALLFAAYVFLKGHQEPGGGFVGGLVVSVALIVHRMAWGEARLDRLLPVHERTLIALGLLLACGTAAGAWYFGLPLLTSANGHLLLFGQDLHWATVALFDLGVMLVVVGTVVGIVSALSLEVEGA